MLLFYNSPLGSSIDHTQLLGSHRLWFMRIAVNQGHRQHYLLNIWAHLAGSLSTAKLKQVIIAFLNEIPKQLQELMYYFLKRSSRTEVILEQLQGAKTLFA